MRRLSGLQEICVAAREESAVLCFPSRRGLTPRGSKGEIMGYSLFSDENIIADSDVITVAECNWDCRCGIAWGRQIPLDSLEIDEDYSFTRY